MRVTNARGVGGSSLINHAHKRLKIYPPGPKITARKTVFFTPVRKTLSLKNR